MAHSLLTLALGVGLCAIALIQKGWFYALGWLGLNFVILSLAQIRRFHILFGKGPDGTLAWQSWILFLPLHLYSLAVLKASQMLSREPACSQVCDELWVGSRPGGADVCNFANIIDLT